MAHLFTIDTDGNVVNWNGETVHRLSDTSQIGDFLMGVRAAAILAPGMSIVREGDIEAWEAATVKRLTGGRLKNTGRPVTPQVPALPGMSPLGIKLPRTFETYSGRRSI